MSVSSHYLANLFNLPSIGQEQTIIGLSADSRLVKPGFLFAVLSGVNVNGSLFIQSALTSGANTLLHDGSHPIPDTITQLIHPNPRLALALISAEFYNQPAKKMKMVAITGTNGKTSVAAMIHNIVNSQQQPAAVIGTTGIGQPENLQKNPLTTPDPITLHQHLNRMQNEGYQTVMVEVSSHAIDQYRTAGIPWSVAVFTNLTQDHLDYHGNLDSYFLSKSRLFLQESPQKAVIGVEDIWGEQLALQCLPHMPLKTFSLDGSKKSDFSAHDIQLSWQGSRFCLHTPTDKNTVLLPTPGLFNISNALAASATCWQLGYDTRSIVQGLSQFKPAPGRMQTLNQGQDFSVVVDFAHTPDALERLLNNARQLTKTGRIIAVFGCGGERDLGKRPLMGQIAARLCHQTIVTDDNPRSENPASIRQQIMEGGYRESGIIQEIADRTEAIHQSLKMAKPGDAVLIIGKGHEKVQITASGHQPFDDVKMACQQLTRLGYPSDFS